MANTPVSLVDSLRAEIETVRVPLRGQVKALEELFTLFTQSRSALHRRSYLDIPKFRYAYLRYHTPLNFARATCALKEVRRVHPEVDALRNVVDLGAGTASASLATLFELSPTVQRSYSLYDRSKSSLRVGRRLMTACAQSLLPADQESARIHTGDINLPRLPKMTGPSLIWMAMVLNELPSTRDPDGGMPEFAVHLSRRVSPGSVLIVVEPALRGPARGLLKLHDALVETSAWRVLAPCTHELSCPLLQLKDRPWCHFHFPWRAPALTREVARPLGLDSGEASLAFLALERLATPSQPDASAAATRGARVIGDVMPVQGGKRGVYVCEQGERRLLKSPPPSCQRGDVVSTQDGSPTRQAAAWAPARGKPPPRQQKARQRRKTGGSTRRSQYKKRQQSNDSDRGSNSLEE